MPYVLRVPILATWNLIPEATVQFRSKIQIKITRLGWLRLLSTFRHLEPLKPKKEQFSRREAIRWPQTINPTRSLNNPS